jgi:hypothetical protein
LTFSDGQRDELIHWKDPACESTMGWLLEQETATANGPYDLAVAWAQFPDLRDLVWDAVEKGRVHDVQTRQKLIDIGEGCYMRYYTKLPGEEKGTLLRYNLSDVHARYFGTRMEKDEWRLKYGELRKLPLDEWPEGAKQYAEWPEGAKQYAQYDARATSWVYQHQAIQQARMKRDPSAYLHDEAPQVRAHWALHLMSCWGFATDDAQVDKVVAAIDEEQPVLAERLQAVNLVRATGTRNEKLAKQMMWEAVGTAGELTDTGYKKVKAKLLSKEEALEAGYIKIDEEWCEVSNNDNLIDYYKYRQNQLLKSKLKHFKSGLLPLQTSFEVLKDTGRTSSSENKILPYSAALQNLPRKEGMRECLVARPRYLLLASDFGQAELVSLAQVTYSAFGYSKMRDLLNADMDVHVDFGRAIMAKKCGKEIAYADAWDMHTTKGGIDTRSGQMFKQSLKESIKQWEAAEMAHPFLLMKDMRQAAKGADFGIPGGLGAASLQSYCRKVWGVTLTLQEAKELKRDWLKWFPEMKDYFRMISRLCEEGNGRTDIQLLMSNRWRGNCRYTQACNTYFQSLTADAAKAALFEVSRRCYTVKSSDLYGCRPLLFVHDENILEAPEEQAAEAAAELQSCMVEVYQRYTPDVKITADAHIMRRWSKSAEGAWDERGKLIPWEDRLEAA